MPTCPPPPAAAPSRLLKGKTGPNCLFMMSGAQACCHAGGCAASLQGQSTTSIRRLPLAASQQSKTMEFTHHFSWAVDSSVASNSRAKGDVAVGLDAAAQAFRLLPVAEADRWNLKALAEMDDGEKAWPHVKKCQVVGPAATGAQCLPSWPAFTHTPHLTWFHPRKRTRPTVGTRTASPRWPRRSTVARGRCSTQKRAARRQSGAAGRLVPQERRGPG